MTDRTVLAGRYRLDEQLATGGMGVVWRARDQLLERDVAVKLLHDALADDQLAAERFRREALTAAGMAHPNIANVYDYVEEDGRPGIVMELIDGETLAQRLARDGALPVNEAVRIATAVLDALAAAHAAGIVHRDIKPANILLTPGGGVKVTDFGIARSLAVSQLTSTGTILGTAHYSAPEQVRGQQSSPATDVYSTGVVVYEMLTGSRPFEADSAVGVAMKRLHETPVPPSALRAGIPLTVERVVMRALEVTPPARYPSASAMRDALAGSTAAGPPTQVFTGDAPDEPTIVLPPSPAPGLEPASAAAPVAADEHGSRARSDLVRWSLIGAALIALVALALVAFTGKHQTPRAHARTSPTSRPSPAATMRSVPNVIGDTLDEARAEILDVAGFDHYHYRIVDQPGVEPGTVFDQQPAAGTLMAQSDPQGPVILVAPEAPTPTHATKPPPPPHHGHGKHKHDG